MGSNTRGYIITTQSGTLNEYTPSIAGRGIPIVPSGRVRQPNPTIPYTLVDGLYSKFPIGTGSLTAETGGGGGGGVTAQANLAHWWKMNEGSTTSATDYGNDAADGTNFTMSGVTSNAGGGPSAVGSPNSISTDGVNDVINTKLSNGATKTPVGDLFDNSGGISVAMWLKIPSATTTYKTYWFAGTQVYTTDDGAGMFFRQVDGGSGDALWTWFEQNNYTSPATFSIDDIKYVANVGTGWVHWAYTFPASGVAKIYINGSLIHSYASNDPVDTAINPGSNDAWFSLGVLTRPVGAAPGTENNVYHAAAHFSDVRLYDKELTSTEVAAIAAGDWT
jgi:hypothetical protein